MECPVGIGEFRVAAAPGILVTRGLGSCVGVILYDADVRLGGLAHIMLPNSRDFLSFNNPYKFADLAIPAIIAEMRTRGARMLKARLVGGARMFANGVTRAGFDIGDRNAVQAKLMLGALAVPVVGEDLGGSVGRTVLLDIALGRVTVRTVGHGAKIL
ncbi:MAG: Chemoreceptor glutamine deamidase CheD [Firmicutes bacterium]|nr:Chemoreceptor glutamine deamidase CheD [candidate division NPL-UPA2 bacterium]